MGNLISWSAPSSEAAWNFTRIYRANSLAGTYALVATQALDMTNPDTTYYDESGGSNHYYRVQFYNSSTGSTSSQSDPISGASTTVTYTTPSKVASRIQFRNSQNQAHFDGTTKPTIWEVIEMIREAEDEVDRQTQHAWRERYSYDTSDSNDFESHDLYYDYKYLTGIPIHLQHRHVRQFDTTKGDQILVWNGSNYEDWVTTRTEGRANDWWCDYRQGTIWLRTYIYRKRPRGVQIRYRYGEQEVPLDIEKATTLLVAAELARMDDRSFLIPEGGDGIKLDKKADDWEAKAKELLHRNKELPLGY